MKHLWDEPWHTVLEVENRKCKIVKMMESMGIQQFKVNDVRGLSVGLIRHLVELPLD